MCGIAGIVAFKHGGEDYLRKISIATHCLLHRGPGIVLLCCRQTARHLAERPERLLPEPEAFRASALSPDSLSPLQPAQGDEA